MRWATRLGAITLATAGCSLDPSSAVATGFGSGDTTEGTTTDEMASTTAGETGSGTEAEGGSDTSGSVKFDLAGGNTDGPPPCEMEDEFEFSYIWIANSIEGTVSKIDTVTGVELARYATGKGDPDPSRTSVNLHGDVAVVNRGGEVDGETYDGGVIKIAARLQDCVDQNGDAMITTSQGPDDVLAWGTDECVLWSVTVPSSDAHPDAWAGPRPVAWEPGLLDDGCTIGENPRLWFGWYDPDQDAGVIRRLDGATGQTLDELTIDGFASGSYGPYGGAVDRDGDFWVVGHGAAGKVLHIDAETLGWELLDNPGPAFSFYGMALDENGQLWIGGRNGAVSTYDPQTQAWTDLGQLGGVLRGIAVDREGRAWAAANGPCRLVEVDVQTKTVIDADIPLPGCEVPVGVSIDIEGYVWVVDQWANAAFKVDPETHQIVAVVEDLQSPYTYSDMTGAGLNLVTNPPAG